MGFNSFVFSPTDWNVKAIPNTMGECWSNEDTKWQLLKEDGAESSGDWG